MTLLLVIVCFSGIRPGISPARDGFTCAEANGPLAGHPRKFNPFSKGCAPIRFKQIETRSKQPFSEIHALRIASTCQRRHLPSGGGISSPASSRLEML
jgi:hypothetical protein